MKQPASITALRVRAGICTHGPRSYTAAQARGGPWESSLGGMTPSWGPWPESAGGRGVSNPGTVSTPHSAVQGWSARQWAGGHLAGGRAAASAVCLPHLGRRGCCGCFTGEDQVRGEGLPCHWSPRAWAQLRGGPGSGRGHLAPSPASKNPSKGPEPRRAVASAVQG